MHYGSWSRKESNIIQKQEKNRPNSDNDWSSAQSGSGFVYVIVCVCLHESVSEIECVSVRVCVLEREI